MAGRLAAVIWAGCLMLAGAAPGSGSAAQYQALGLEQGASEIDVQVSYKMKIQKLRPELDTNPGALVELTSAQKAYEALSDFEMREEALSFVDYWNEVAYLRSDDELRSFTELQVGGSGRLRIIFVTQRPDSKVYEAYGAAIRLYGRARVAQLCHKSMTDARGMLGKFYASLRVSEGGIILFDPLSRASKITYELSGVGSDTERLLSGDSGTSKLARVQEYDQRNFAGRCGDNPTRCSWMMVLGTDGAFEDKRNDLAELLKQFTEACKSLQVMEKYPQLACFWLRLDRSPEWKVYLAGIQSVVPGKPTVAVLQRRQEGGMGIQVSPTGEAIPESLQGLDLTTQESARWSTFDGIARYSVGLVRFFEKSAKSELFDASRMPELPVPLRPEDEPQESDFNRYIRYYQEVMDCVTEPNCLYDLSKKSLLTTGIISPESSDAEAKTMLVGTGLATFMFAFFFLRRILGCLCPCCCRRSAGKMSEDEVLKRIEMLITVDLQRASPAEKYGLGIEPSNMGGMTITAVNPDGLVGKWNAQQTKEAAKIQRGDRVVMVTFESNGQQVQKTKSSDMATAFTSGLNRLVLTVATTRGEAEVLKLTATVGLDGISLSSDLLTSEVDEGKAGLLVSQISPKLQERNSSLRGEGACCTQLIEVGDRLVMSKIAAEPAAHVVIAKLRYTDQVRTDTFDVSLQRSGPEDRLGMQVRQHPSSPKHMEVLDVLPEGMVARHGAAPGARKVLKGDRLIAANGKDGPQAMGAEFKAETLMLRFERWIDGANGAAPGGIVSAAPAAAAAPPMPGAPPPPGLGKVGPPMPGPGGLVAAPPLSSSPGMPPMQPSVAQAAPTGFPSAAAGGFGQPAPAPAAGMQPPMQPPRPTPPPRTGKVPPSGGDDSCALCASLLAALLLALAAGFVAVFGNTPPPQLASLSKRPKERFPLPSGSRHFVDMIRPELHGDIGALLFVAGIMLTVHFVLYELVMVANPQKRRLFPQLCIAGAASNCLGFGSLFLLTWAGVYV
eukprot:TRINITY_DN19299_c0_g1_i1.p1 TRINITY_DN19299_c0_g1~~TRINITY_DN19299_c0_g1_i1.p1  ORF type:complete len:1009 (-),score=245.19 TRINITY_DN19299_c0_g1_i1:318-3344(-)